MTIRNQIIGYLSLILLFYYPVTTASAAVVSNIALDKPVTLVGDYGRTAEFFQPYQYGYIFGHPPSPANATSLTDGIFHSERQWWHNDSVWWDSKHTGSLNNEIIIDLQDQFEISAFSVQADNNDYYRLEYLSDSGSWQTIWDIPYIGGSGLTTRSILLNEPILATMLRFSVTGGDHLYSVSEIQAFDGIPTVVPIPSAIILFTFGLTNLFLFSQRKTKQNTS